MSDKMGVLLQKKRMVTFVKEDGPYLAIHLRSNKENEIKNNIS